MGSSGFQKPTKYCVFLPTGCSMSSDQRAKVIALDQKIQPKIPFYITAMHRRSVAYGILAISKNYAMKHLASENGTIQLSRLDDSKIWAVDLDITTDGRFAVSTGWMDFILDNKLQEGDVCVFQPSKSKNGVALTFHPLEESRCLQPPPPGYVASARRSVNGDPKPTYMFPLGTFLNDEQKSKVEEEVGAIQSESEIPIYVAVMKISNVNREDCAVVFGTEYAAKYLPHWNRTLVLRRPAGAAMEQGHTAWTWEAELRVKKSHVRRHTIRRGWRKFADDNKLKLGDVCLFNRMENTKKLTMNVHIIRERAA